uniref:Uncharacterized protein n=1 Tax=Xiphophorus couchianus TaxID=32473 RepID=A0A3B5M375_9TELE
MLTVTLCSSNRPPNLLDGSTEVTPAEGTGGDPASSARTPRSSKHTERSRAPQAGASTAGGGGGGEGEGRRGEPDSDSPPCSVSPASLDVFRSRSIFRPTRRSSSGYFSFDCDSLPSSPLSPHPVTADKATQTPSLTGQVMNHALQRMAVEHGGLGLQGEQTSVLPPPPSETSTTWEQIAVNIGPVLFIRPIPMLVPIYHASTLRISALE